MSAMLDNVERILRQSRVSAEEKQRVLEAHKARARAAKAEATWRTRACPGCGGGLRLVGLQATDASTLFVCERCSWTRTIPFLMDEARLLGEAQSPGVTGKARPGVRVEWRSHKVTLT